MTPSLTDSPRFELNFRSHLTRSGLRNRAPEILPSFWAPPRTGPFDYSPDSDPQAPSSQTARPSFRQYIEAAWPIIEPATPFVTGYHVEAIAEHLQAVSDGLIQNLIINIPPRHSKSTLVSVIWPTWEWIEAPWLRWLFLSYAQTLSTRDSVKRRRLIESEWYRERWGDRYRLTADQNQKMRFENDRTGVMIASSVGGTGTGEGGQRLVVDDPHSAQDVESDVKRESVLDWWDGTMATRADQPGSTSRVIVMQRLHELDLVGHILEKAKDGGEQYDHLILPAEYEPRVQVCMADLQHDPRTEPGQLLSPERFNRDAVNKLKVELQHRAAGQLQQRPEPAGGAIYKQAWWEADRNRFDAGDEQLVKAVLARWLLFDTAMKDAERNDFTACLCFELLPDYRLLARDAWHSHLQFPDLVEDIKATAVRQNHDGKLRGVVIEDKNSGTSAVQTLRAAADPWLAAIVIPFTPLGSKIYRARQASVWCSADMILLPYPSTVVPWLFEFEQELFKFPTAAHDDQADTFSMGIIYLENYLAQGLRARLASAGEAA